MRQRIVWLLPFLFLCLTAESQVSYWFQGWQRQGNARDAQEYFMLAGTNITFTYPANNHVVINATGTNVVLPNVYATNVINPPWQIGCPNLTNWCQLPTNVLANYQPLCANLTAWCANNPATYTNGLGGGGSPQTNISYTAVTNAPWQWGCDNLTNWCVFPTNVLGNFDPSGSAQAATNGFPWGVLYQPACANLSNWCLLPTNLLSSTSGFVTNEFTTNIGLTLSQFQPACANLSNWCLFPTNILGTIATNSTNFTLTVSNNIWVNIGTSNFITSASSGVQTNWTNIWTGTNTFYSAPLYALQSLHVGATNVGSFPTEKLRIRTGDGLLGAGTDLGISEQTKWNATPGNFEVRIEAARDTGAISPAMELSAAGIIIDTKSTDNIEFSRNTTRLGSFLTAGTFFVGQGGASLQLPGLIEGTNVFYSHRYGRFIDGAVINSNSWTDMSALSGFVAGDAFNNGDCLIVSSNSIPYAICKSTNGVVTTNLMLHVAEASTNDWHTSGNTGLGAGGGTLGTLDNSPINIKVNNVGFGRLDSLPTIALGVGATASVANDVAIAPTSVANGGGATAIGYNSQALGVGATALGYGSFATTVGATAIGFQTLAAGDYSLAIGLNAGQNSVGNYTVCIGRDSATTGLTFAESAFMLGYKTLANGDFSYAIGNSATANNNGSMVFSDSTAAGYSDTAANQFVGYFTGGYKLNSVGAGLHTDGPTFSTNGYYYNASTNGVAPPPAVIQPLHTWASMMMTNTNTFNFGAGTYGVVTNYSVVRTNLMFANKAHGCVTNTIAGYYYCAIHMSAKSLDPSAFVEGDILLNGVARDEISFQSQFDNPARYKGMSAFGILYVTNNTQITFQIKSSGASGVEVSRAQLVVMPP